MGRIFVEGKTQTVSLHTLYDINDKADLHVLLYQERSI